MAHPTVIDAARTTMADKPKKRNWIKGAVEGGKGKFKAKAEAAGKSTSEFAAEKADAPGKLGKEARLAETLTGMRHRQASKLYTHKNSPKG